MAETKGREEPLTDENRHKPVAERPPEQLLPSEKEALRIKIEAEAKSGRGGNYTKTEQQVISESKETQNRLKKINQDKLDKATKGKEVSVEVSRRQTERGSEVIRYIRDASTGKLIATQTKTTLKVYSGKAKLSDVAPSLNRDSTLKPKKTEKETALSIATKKAQGATFPSEKESSETSLPSDQIFLEQEKLKQTFFPDKQSQSSVISAGNRAEFEQQRKDFLKTKFEVSPLGDFQFFRDAPSEDVIRAGIVDKNRGLQLSGQASLFFESSARQVKDVGVSAVTNPIIFAGSVAAFSGLGAAAIPVISTIVAADVARKQQKINIMSETNSFSFEGQKQITQTGLIGEGAADVALITGFDKGMKLRRGIKQEIKEAKFEKKISAFEQDITSPQFKFDLDPQLNAVGGRQFTAEIDLTGSKPSINLKRTTSEPFQSTLTGKVIENLEAFPSSSPRDLIPSKTVKLTDIEVNKHINVDTGETVTFTRIGNQIQIDTSTFKPKSKLQKLIASKKGESQVLMEFQEQTFKRKPTIAREETKITRDPFTNIDSRAALTPFSSDPELVISKEKTLMSTDIVLKQKSSEKTIKATSERQDVKFDIVQETRLESQLGSPTAFNLAQESLQKMNTKQALKLNTLQETKSKSKATGAAKTAFAIPAPVGFPIFKFPKDQSKAMRNEFNVFVRKGGKFEKFNEAPLDLETASRVGQKKVNRSLRATFTIRDLAGNPLSQELASNLKIDTKRFKRKKENNELLFIEKPSFRLSTKQETGEIQLAKKLKNLF